MSVPQKLTDELLVKCNRRCCISRRFDPLHLQVHHIVESSEGGTDDPGNLIAVCLTCHADVHSRTMLTRRFTAEELKGHRDATVKAVHDGRLPTTADGGADVGRLISSLLCEISEESGPVSASGEGLSRCATGMLLRSVADNGELFSPKVRRHPNMAPDRARQIAQYGAALDELLDHGLVEWHSGEIYAVTYDGFLLADELLAAGAGMESETTEQ